MIHLFWAGVLCVIAACVIGAFEPRDERRASDQESTLGVFGIVLLLLSLLDWLIDLVTAWH